MVMSAIIETDLTSDTNVLRGKILFWISVFVYTFAVWSPIIGQFYDRATPENTTIVLSNGTSVATSVNDPPSWVNVIIWGKSHLL